MTNLEIYKIDDLQKREQVNKWLTMVKELEDRIINSKNAVAMLEEQKEQNKENLRQAMEQYGVKTLEVNDYKITYVSESTRNSFDSLKFKNENPELYAKYLKTVKTKSYLRVAKKKDLEKEKTLKVIGVDA